MVGLLSEGPAEPRKTYSPDARSRENQEHEIQNRQQRTLSVRQRQEIQEVLRLMST